MEALKGDDNATTYAVAWSNQPIGPENFEIFNDFNQRTLIDVSTDQETIEFGKIFDEEGTYYFRVAPQDAYGQYLVSSNQLQFTIDCPEDVCVLGGELFVENHPEIIELKVTHPNFTSNSTVKQTLLNNNVVEHYQTESGNLLIKFPSQLSGAITFKVKTETSSFSSKTINLSRIENTDDFFMAVNALLYSLKSIAAYAFQEAQTSDLELNPPNEQADLFQLFTEIYLKELHNRLAEIRYARELTPDEWEKYLELFEQKSEEFAQFYFLLKSRLTGEPPPLVKQNVVQEIPQDLLTSAKDRLKNDDIFYYSNPNLEIAILDPDKFALQLYDDVKPKSTIYSVFNKLATDFYTEIIINGTLFDNTKHKSSKPGFGLEGIAVNKGQLLSSSSTGESAKRNRERRFWFGTEKGTGKYLISGRPKYPVDLDDSQNSQILWKNTLPWQNPSIVYTGTDGLYGLVYDCVPNYPEPFNILIDGSLILNKPDLWGCLEGPEFLQGKYDTDLISSLNKIQTAHGGIGLLEADGKEYLLVYASDGGNTIEATVRFFMEFLNVRNLVGVDGASSIAMANKRTENLKVHIAGFRHKLLASILPSQTIPSYIVFKRKK